MTLLQLNDYVRLKRVLTVHTKFTEGSDVAPAILHDLKIVIIYTVFHFCMHSRQVDISHYFPTNQVFSTGFLSRSPVTIQ